MLRKSETIMQQIQEYGIELMTEDRALSNMTMNLLLRNHLLLRREGSHPCASLKLIFCSAKVELDTESPSKKARLAEAKPASADPYTGMATKVEATSPSKSQGSAQEEMQEACSNDDEEERMQKMVDIAQTEMQRCIDQNESNEATDGKIRKKQDAANSKCPECSVLAEVIKHVVDCKFICQHNQAQ